MILRDWHGSQSFAQKKQQILSDYPRIDEKIQSLQQHLDEQDFWQIIGLPDKSLHASPTRTSRVRPTDLEAAPENITEIEGKGQTGVTAIEGEDDQPTESEMPTSHV